MVSLVKSDWRIMWGIRTKLPAFRQATLDRLYGQAGAYVWGWQDAGGAKSARGGEDPWYFGNAYGVVAAEYESQARGSRPAIATAFKEWLTTGAIS